MPLAECLMIEARAPDNEGGRGHLHQLQGDGRCGWKAGGRVNAKHAAGVFQRDASRYVLRVEFAREKRPIFKAGFNLGRELYPYSSLLT